MSTFKIRHTEVILFVFLVKSSKAMALSSEIEFMFGNLKLCRTLEFEKIKVHYKNSGDLADWIVNLWFMAKIENKKAFQNDILAQIELIKENWNENFVDVNYVIDHLVRNDVNLMDLDLYNSSANRDKQLIYDILLQPSKKKVKKWQAV